MMKQEIRSVINKTVAMRDTTYPYLSNLARDMGVLSGHENYTKFVILGRSRTGSNLLRGLLNSHPQIQVFSEIFRNPDVIDWGLPGYRQSHRTSALMRRDPVAFLQTRIFGKYPPQIAAVGFKLFYYHAREPELEPIWAYLADAPDIKIIHIKRRNNLRTHLSRERAIRTDEWANVNGSKSKEDPIELDYEKCLADFIETRAWENKLDAFFQIGAMFTVGYETLAGNIEREMGRVQNFLGVGRRALAPATRKQASKPLSAAISNYDDLKERFSGTQWEAFFED